MASSSNAVSPKKTAGASFPKGRYWEVRQDEEGTASDGRAKAIYVGLVYYAEKTQENRKEGKNGD